MVDMTDITAMYSDTYASAANQRATMLQRKIGGAGYSRATDDELLDACKQFEAYFVEQMFKGMLKTIPQSEETSNYTSTIMDYYKDQMIQGAAEQASKQGGLGLAQMLYEQMKRNYGITDMPAVEAAAVASAAEEA